MLQIREITRINFSQNPCSISTCFSPLKLEFWDALEVLVLYEAFATAFAQQEGPLPYFSSYPAWNRHIVNHTLYFSNVLDIGLAWYWHTWISWFWHNACSLPPSLPTLRILKRDISQILLSFANLQVSASTSGVFTHIAVGSPIVMVPSCLILTSRTDFLCPVTRVNIQHLGLRLRESFEAKRRPRTPWSHERYLQLHAELCQEVGESDFLPAEDSDSSDT